MSIRVPRAVVDQARTALNANESRPVRGVGGVSVARGLVAGVVTDETIRRMRRFFTISSRAFESETQLMHTAADSALLRSWALHGGQAGKTWSEGVYKARLAEGGEEDAWVDLLRTDPIEIYGKLNFGAWIWEYGMDVRRAARFVEEYTRTHAVDFRFDRAFGESANTVKRALVRRVEGANPFKQLAAQMVEDAYREEAQADLRECQAALGQHALFNWPNFIGLAIVATHDSQAAGELLEGSRYPWRGRDARSVMEYLDPLGDFVTFFHPDGSCYLGDAPNGLNGRLDQLMWQIHEGEVVSEVRARATLGEARIWTANNRAARGLGHTLLKAWARRDWDVIRESLPLDSPVRASFESFVGKLDGTWLAPKGL